MGRARLRRRRLPGRCRPDDAGRRARPHAARAAVVAPDLRHQRNRRRLHGRGPKTVMPAKASAKLSFRLVGKQNPESIVAGLPRLRRPRACRPTSRRNSSAAAAARRCRCRSRTRRCAGRAARSRPNGASRRRWSAAAARSRSSARSSASSAWTACSSASALDDDTCIRRTRNTSEPRSTRARGPGRAFSPRSRRERGGRRSHSHDPRATEGRDSSLCCAPSRGAAATGGLNGRLD